MADKSVIQLHRQAELWDLFVSVPCDDFYEAKIGNVGENVLLHTLIEIVLILLISELSYRFIENPLRKFHYKDTFRTVRNWFSKPVISRQKPWLLPGLLVSLVALYGIATAPVNYVDAQQQQLKKILLPIKAAEQTQKCEWLGYRKYRRKFFKGNGSRTISNGKIWVDRSPGEEGRRAGNYRFW